MKPGAIWLIGLSGAGKTTIGQLLVERIRSEGRRVVFLDGDVLRNVFGNDLGFTVEDRDRNAERLSRLTKFLVEEGVDVVAAVLSIFPSWQDWNRENVPNYFEVFLNPELETLIRRDSKGLYSKARAGRVTDVVGVDIPFPRPTKSNLILDDRALRNDLSEIRDLILASVKGY